MGMEVRRGSLSSIILLVLEKSVDTTVNLMDFAYNSHFYAGYGRNEVPKSTLSKALKRLRVGGFIEEVKISKETYIKLTNYGKKNLSQHKWTKKNWDGKWRVVIFDIPEQKRVIRNLFRRNLKRWGFKKLQKSVWASKQDCFKELEEYVKDIKIEKWIILFEAQKISFLDIT